MQNVILSARKSAIVVLSCLALVSGAAVPAAMANAKGVTAADLKYVDAQIASFSKLPKFIPPGPKFNAKKLMKGRVIVSVPANSAIQFVQTIDTDMQSIAKSLGFQVLEYNNQGQPSQWAQGLQYAITKHASLVDLLAGVNPSLITPQIKQARKAHIPVVTSHLYGFPPPKSAYGLSANIAANYTEAGRLLADWAIAKTHGHANVLVLETNEVLSTPYMMKGIMGEFKAHCGTSCTVTVENFSITDWPTKVQPDVAAALASNPHINYIIPLYDSMCEYVVPAVQLANATKRVHIDTYNGTPFVLQMIREGKVQMDVGENLDWIARAVLDDEMRLATGQKFVYNEHMPMYIWSAANIKSAGNPPTVSTGYGNAYVAGYNKVWEVTR